MRKLLIYSIYPLCLFFLFCCSGPNPEEELTPEEKDVFVTNRDKSADFSSYKTFIVADSVEVIKNESQYTFERQAIDISILKAIEEEMLKLGYVLVDSSTKADLGISVSKVSYDYTGVGVDYTNYGGYGSSFGGGYYDPFGYGGYGYNYPSYYTYEVKQGSVFIDMIDLKNPSQDNKYKVLWNGQMIDGLGRLSSQDRIIKGVRGLFTQSTYLKLSK